MKIGYDAKRAFWNNTGLGNYSRSVISGMATFHPEHQLTLFSPGINYHSELKTTLQNKTISLFDLGNGLIGRAKRVVGFNNGSLDIFHGLSNELPIFNHNSRTKLVVSVHDLLFLRYPEFYPFIDRQIYKLKTLKACKKAHLIIAISQQTKQDLIEFLNIPEHKIKVHYQSCHPQFRVQHTEQDIVKIKAKYGISKPYILQVGTLEERKNALLTLKAYKDCKFKESFNLVLIGNRTSYCNQLEQFVADHKLKEKVNFIYKSTFSDFPVLYQGSALSLYPSLFEGFGIPVLEAMTSGIPVITSEGGCFHEVGADAVLYINPLNPKDLAEKIDLVLDNESLSKELIEKGKNRALYFEPENLMSGLDKIYKQLFL
ncbi:MAG: glycosyltransferase family 4 protein [Opitutaceae bacterium]|nr:glycosyltransferase family 4 protein [Cytophagales bacterium]